MRSATPSCTAAGEKLLVQAETSLGCPEDYSIAFLPELLGCFCALHPEVELRMACAPTTKLRPLLHRRQIDKGLVSITDFDGHEFIREESFVWVADARVPDFLTHAILPMALPAPMSLDYRAARDAMQASDHRYKVAFASNSLAGLIAITRSG